MKDLLKSNILAVFVGLLVLLGVAVFAVDSMPWVRLGALDNIEGRVKSLEVQKNFTNEGYREFEIMLGRIDERVKNIEEDIKELGGFLREHQRNHHNLGGS